MKRVIAVALTLALGAGTLVLVSTAPHVVAAPIERAMPELVTFSKRLSDDCLQDRSSSASWGRDAITITRLTMLQCEPKRASSTGSREAN
jgi:hypothetical protein